jgi:circadian clock protein KaiC
MKKIPPAPRRKTRSERGATLAAETTIESPRRTLPKAPTGIQGLDELTGGGLPLGRPTLVCGGAGCGKTLLAMEFLVRGAVEFGEPGVFMAFEENPSELVTNFGSLGHDLPALIAQKKLAIEFIRVERGEIEETGDYDLEGLFIRLGYAIDSIGAKRVVLDTIEVLFSGLSNTAILRAELRRLFQWLKDKGVTAIVTAERGENSLSRYGLEEYVADCVILLDNRIEGQMTTRRLRIAKYRGSAHGTSEYPFLIDADGISIRPITSVGLNHTAGSERVSSGIASLDAMMGGKGFYRGSSVLVSGTAGAGKTSIAAHFAHAATVRAERCIWFAFEESSSQIIRNMRSIGIDLEPAVQAGLLRIQAERPTVHGLEMHLVNIEKLINQFEPRVIIIDPLSNFIALGSEAEVRAMLTRLTALFTSLNTSSIAEEATVVGVSSLMDSWLRLRDVRDGAEHNRLMYLLKSRGMAHSNQCREFFLTDRGVELREVYTGVSGTLVTGTARAVLEAQEKAEDLTRVLSTESKKRLLEQKRHAMEARIDALRADLGAEEIVALQTITEVETSTAVLADNREKMRRLRDSSTGPAAAVVPVNRQPAAAA